MKQAKDKLLITFAENATNEQKLAVLNNPLLKPFDPKKNQFTKVMIAESLSNLTDLQLESLLSGIRKNEQILAANYFFIYPADGTYQGLTNRFIVKTQENAEGIALLNRLVNETGCTIINATRYDPYTFILSAPKATNSSAMDMANRFHETGYFKYAEPCFLLMLKPHTNDTYYFAQWSLENTGQYNGTVNADMDVPPAWAVTQRKGEGIVVAVIDEGVDLNHPDLSANLVRGYDAVQLGPGYPNPPLNVGNNGECARDDAHGTACAGIISAVADNNIGISGVAPLSKVMPIRIAYTDPSTGFWVTDWSWMADGINWAHCHGADILSNSWGGGSGTSTLDNQINAAFYYGRGGLGSPVFFSTGNYYSLNDAPFSVNYPATLPNVIAVGAMSNCHQRKGFSSCDGENTWGGRFGAGLDLVAPGVKIATTDISGPAGYSATGTVPTYNADYCSQYNGTSAACPNAAGVMALVLSNKSCLTGKDAKVILESSAQKVGNYTYSITAGNPNGTWNSDMGYGKVNALTAVNLALTYNPRCPDYYSLWYGCERIENRVSSSINNSEELPKKHSKIAGINLIIYPNPFSENPFISYSLSEPAKVNITIYNGQGEKVVDLAKSEIQPAGNYSQELPTQKLAAGIYYYIIDVNGKRETRKMIKTGSR